MESITDCAPPHHTGAFDAISAKLAGNRSGLAGWRTCRTASAEQMCYGYLRHRMKRSQSRVALIGSCQALSWTVTFRADPRSLQATFSRDCTRQTMLNSVDTFDVPTRVRELELSIARRVREALQPYIGDPELLDSTAREVLLISRDYAGSFQAINNRARIRQERAVE